MSATSSKTKSVRPKLSESTKHLSVPDGFVSSEWSKVRETCVKKMGITFDDWQEEAGRLILTKRPDGTLATTIDGVGISIPRQVGKTYLIAAMVFALCINRPGLLVIWSAHHARTHGETFLAMQAFARRAKVAPHIDQVFKGSGDEEVRFHNRSRILFGARERGFGRGIPGVDILIMDEAQILSDKAMSNMLATLNTSRFGLHLYIGTPPKPEDMSEAFTRMRSEAMSGTLKDGAWIEFGADREADSNDRKQWKKANPSFPRRTPPESMLRLKRKLTDADWLREGMGIWDEDALESTVIAAEEWRDSGVTKPPPNGVRSLGVKFAPDGSSVAVAGALKHDDGIHVELVGAHSGSMASGTASLVSWVAERSSKYAAIVVDGKSHAGTFVNALIEAGVSKRAIVVPTWPEVATANSMLLDGLILQQVTHLATEGQSVLDESATKTTKKIRGAEGAWQWDSPADPAKAVPIQAASLAHFGAKTSKRRPGRTLSVGVM